jgi:UPF0716 protein FxsA
MVRWLGVTAILLVVLAIAEIVVFIAVAKAIGLAWAVLLAVVTSVIGYVLLRREGSRGWRRFRGAVAEGRPPGREAVDGVVGLLGALLLLGPGFLTDTFGLLLLAAPVRAVARAGVRRAAEARIPPAVAGQVFGPRFVRAKRAGPAGGAASEPAAEPTPGPQQAIEGEIIDPPEV